jgi:hypothetical protein
MLFVALGLVTVAVILVVHQLPSIAQNADAQRLSLASSVEAIHPREALPGIRFTAFIEPKQFEFPLELDVWLSADLVKGFELVNSETRNTSVFDKEAVQLVLAQYPPKGMAGRVLLLNPPPSSHAIDFYLRARNEKVDPDSAIKSLSTESDIRIMSVRKDRESRD